MCCKGAGEREKESARETMGRGKKGGETPVFSLFPYSPARLLFLDHCFFYWDSQWKPASAEERETNPIVDLDNNSRLVQERNDLNCDNHNSVGRDLHFSPFFMLL